MSSFKQKIACIEMHAIIIIICGPIKMHIIHLFHMSGLTLADRVSVNTWTALSLSHGEVEMVDCSNTFSSCTYCVEYLN